jgi:transposase-like protein
MEIAPLDPGEQFCRNRACPEYGQAGKGNIYIHSHKERRYGCHTCEGTFAETRGTMFYRLRTPPETTVDALAQLVERGSIRGVARAKGVKPDTVLAWLRLAGEHAAEVNAYLIRDLHLTEAQVDELWTFVRRSKGTSQRTRTRAATTAT